MDNVYPPIWATKPSCRPPLGTCAGNAALWGHSVTLQLDTPEGTTQGFRIGNGASEKGGGSSVPRARTQQLGSEGPLVTRLPARTGAFRSWDRARGVMTGRLLLEHGERALFITQTQRSASALVSVLFWFFLSFENKSGMCVSTPYPFGKGCKKQLSPFQVFHLIKVHLRGQTWTLH